MDINTIITIIASAIALSSLFFSIYVYRKHEKKLNEQENLINEFNINKLKQEDEERKKAVIKATITKKEKRLRIIKISNIGKAIAHNLNIKVKNAERVDFQTKQLNNIELRPNSFVELKAKHMTNDFITINIHCTWDDDFKKNNQDKIPLILK